MKWNESEFKSSWLADVLFWNLPGGAEKEQENLQPGKLVIRQRFATSTRLISLERYHYTTCLAIALHGFHLK
jgi:hypothetical protein